MSQKRLDVHSCLLNTLTRRYGPSRTSDLLGVNYVIAVPPDTEFPRTLPVMDFFVRFFLAGVGGVRFAVRVDWLDADGRPVRRLNEFQYRVRFDPLRRVDDHVLRMHRIEVAGVGMYSVRLYRRAKHRWKGSGWRLLATDYFEITR
jgi:hypothetical protein